MNNRKYLPRKIKCRDYSNYSQDILTHRLTAVDWSIIYDCENVDNCAELLNDILEKHFNDIASVVNKRVKGRPCPWLNDDVKKQMNAPDKIYRKGIKSKNEEDWKQDKLLRNKCNNALLYAKNKYHEELLIKNNLNSCKFLSTIRKLFPKAQPPNTDSHPNKIEKVKLFADWFSSVVEK